VAGYQGLILHTSDGGKTWETQKTGTTQTLESISFLDANHGWAIGWASCSLRCASGGKKATSPPTVDPVLLTSKSWMSRPVKAARLP
jgi:photosystem II stability/assembly factor-like uncharacterized protein